MIASDMPPIQVAAMVKTQLNKKLAFTQPGSRITSAKCQGHGNHHYTCLGWLSVKGTTYHVLWNDVSVQDNGHYMIGQGRIID